MALIATAAKSVIWQPMTMFLLERTCQLENSLQSFLGSSTGGTRRRNANALVFLSQTVVSFHFSILWFSFTFPETFVELLLCCKHEVKARKSGQYWRESPRTTYLDESNAPGPTNPRQETEPFPETADCSNPQEGIQLGSTLQGGVQEDLFFFILLVCAARKVSRIPRCSREIFSGQTATPALPTL